MWVSANCLNLSNSLKHFSDPLKQILHLLLDCACITHFSRMLQWSIDLVFTILSPHLNIACPSFPVNSTVCENGPPWWCMMRNSRLHDVAQKTDRQKLAKPHFTMANEMLPAPNTVICEIKASVKWLQVQACWLTKLQPQCPSFRLGIGKNMVHLKNHWQQRMPLGGNTGSMKNQIDIVWSTVTIVINPIQCAKALSVGALFWQAFFCFCEVWKPVAKISEFDLPSNAEWECQILVTESDGRTNSHCLCVIVWTAKANCHLTFIPENFSHKEQNTWASGPCCRCDSCDNSVWTFLVTSFFCGQTH